MTMKCCTNRACPTFNTKITTEEDNCIFCDEQLNDGAADYKELFDKIFGQRKNSLS